MQLSERLETFSQFLIAVLQSTLNFEYFEKIISLIEMTVKDSHSVSSSGTFKPQTLV